MEKFCKHCDNPEQRERERERSRARFKSMDVTQMYKKNLVSSCPYRYVSV